MTSIFKRLENFVLFILVEIVDDREVVHALQMMNNDQRKKLHLNQNQFHHHRQLSILQHFHRKLKLLSMNQMRKIKKNQRKMEKNIRNITKNIVIRRKARNIIEVKIKKRRQSSMRQHLLLKFNHNIDFRFSLNLYAKEISLLFMYLFSFVLFVSFFFRFRQKNKIY